MVTLPVYCITGIIWLNEIVSGKKYSAKKGYKKKDRSSIFDEEYGKKGKDGFSIHKIDDLEKGGKKSKYFDDGFYKDYDYHSGASAYGGNHKSGAGKKARNYSKVKINKIFHEITKKWNLIYYSFT